MLLTKAACYTRTNFPRTYPLPISSPLNCATTREYLDLTAFDSIADQIRYYKEAIDVLHASNYQYWYKDYDKHIAPKIKAEDRAATQATAEATDAAIQALLGNHPTMRDLTRELTDSLTAEVNKIWGHHLLPLFTRYTTTTAA